MSKYEATPRLTFRIAVKVLVEILTGLPATTGRRAK
jgi:hypothetical protein